MLDLSGTRAVLSQLTARFAEQEQMLNALDAAIGDGDHGSTMLRGMRAGEDAARKSADVIPGPVLVAMANSFQKSSGGAGGTLFSSIFRGIGEAAGMAQTIDAAAFGAGLAAAATTVARVGRARAGGKTMFDALNPAAEALMRGGTPDDAVTASRAGLEATRDMQATQGRARFVARGGVGHLDPGAMSVVMIVETLAGAIQ